MKSKLGNYIWRERGWDVVTSSKTKQKRQFEKLSERDLDLSLSLSHFHLSVSHFQDVALVPAGLLLWLLLIGC